LNDLFNIERNKRKLELTGKRVTGKELDKSLRSEKAYYFFVPKRTRWEDIRHLKTELGSFHLGEEDNFLNGIVFG